jgi:hypothetical protein
MMPRCVNRFFIEGFDLEFGTKSSRKYVKLKGNHIVSSYDVIVTSYDVIGTPTSFFITIRLRDFMFLSDHMRSCYCTTHARIFFKFYFPMNITIINPLLLKNKYLS